MEITSKDLHEDLIKLRKDMEIIKNLLMAEGELTDRSREELAKAREESEEEYTDLEEL